MSENPMGDQTAVCNSTLLGEGCGHPVADHVDKTPNTECCCCTRLQNVMSHVDTCLDCAIKHGKRQVRIRGIAEKPLLFHVEPFIPDGLKTAFWQRYIGKYFDSKLGAS